MQLRGAAQLVGTPGSGWYVTGRRLPQSQDEVYVVHSGDVDETVVLTEVIDRL